LFGAHFFFVLPVFRLCLITGVVFPPFSLITIVVRITPLVTM